MSAAARSLLWAAAAALTWLAASFGPPAAGDPLRPLLLAIPLTVAALVEIERGCRRAGGRALLARVSLGEGAVLALLVLVALGRHQLGVRHPEAVLDPLIAAGLVALLAHRVVRQVVALRPVLGRRLARRPPALFFALPLVVYLALIGWSTAQRPPNGDEPYYLLVAHSLVEDLDAELGDEYADGVSEELVGRRLEPQPRDPVGDDGQVYSRHGALLPLVLAPGYAVAGKHGAMATMAALTAALAWLLLRLAGALWPARPGGALLAWSVFAFTSPVLVYSYQVWSEVPGALLVLVALDRILRLEAQADSGARDWLVLGLSLLLLPILKQRFVIVVGALLALAWWWLPRARKALALLAGALALAGAGVLVHQQVTFGHALRVYDWGIFARQLGKPPLRAAEALTGFFLDSGAGLAAGAPIWLLLVPALLLALREHRRIALGALLLCGPHLAVFSLLADPTGGWAPPFRFGFVLLPVLALLLVPLLDARRRPGARVLFAALALGSALLAIIWVVFPNWTYNFANGRSHLLDHLGLRSGLDLARFFPTMVRSRPATWLWPPALLAVSALWWVPRRPRVRGLAAGAAALLAAAALLLTAARTLPTRVVELEDPYVAKAGGEIYPERWVEHRIRYRGGWRLAPGDSLRAAVRPGGEAGVLALDYLAEGEVVLSVADGRAELARERLEPGEWATLEVAVERWPPSGELVLTAHPAGEPSGKPGSVIADRARFAWRARR